MSGADEESKSLRPETVAGSFFSILFSTQRCCKRTSLAFRFWLGSIVPAETVECCLREIWPELFKRWIKVSTG